MGQRQVNETTRRHSAVVLFTLSFPFGRGEEFLEAELPHLLEVFDRVVVVPTMRTPEMTQTRALPAEVVLVTAPHRLAVLAARFVARHPAEAVRSAVRSLRAGPKPDRILADFKFDIFARAVSGPAALAVSAVLNGATDVVFYSYWLHVPARVAVEVRRILRPRESAAVSRANGFDLYVERDRRGYLPQRQFLLRELSHVFAASSSAEQYLRERYPAFVAKFATERIGTPAAINPGNASLERRHIVSCSYISPVKRLTVLIDDLAEAQKRSRDPLYWTHIGSGQGPHADEVMEHASRKLVPGSFQFLGHLGSNELRTWYSENPASAFVQVSESEGGLAASIQEALGQGIPVIATDVGGITALRDDPDIFDGLLRKDHTPAEFADRLETLLSLDEVTYSRYVAASMAFWSSQCSADTLASSFARRLRRIAETQGRHALA